MKKSLAKPVSRQRKWQLKKQAEGKCTICGQKKPCKHAGKRNGSKCTNGHSIFTTAQGYQRCRNCLEFVVFMKGISEEHTVEILTKMCNMIGLSYDAVKFIRPNWFELHTWTSDEENAFIDWLAEFLVKHKYARKERARYEASKVNMQIGWKTRTGQ